MEIETEALLLPNLTDAGAHYHRGRVAGLANFQETLWQLWKECHGNA